MAGLDSFIAEFSKLDCKVDGHEEYRSAINNMLEEGCQVRAALQKRLDAAQMDDREDEMAEPVGKFNAWCDAVQAVKVEMLKRNLFGTLKYDWCLAEIQKLHAMLSASK